MIFSEEKHHVKEYDYQIRIDTTGIGNYRGVILIWARGDEQYNPCFEIPTRTEFKAAQAARIEAASLARELICTGAIESLLQSPAA